MKNKDIRTRIKNKNKELGIKNKEYIRNKE